MDSEFPKLQHPANWQYGSPLDDVAEKWASRMAHDPESPMRLLGMNRHIFSAIKAYFIAAVFEAAPIKSSWIELRHEVAWKPEDIRPLMLNAGVKVIHAQRQTGKTTEMLKYAFEKYGMDFICVSPSKLMADTAKSLFWGRITTVVDTASLYPVFISAWDIETKLLGHNLPVFVDEWNSICERDKTIILAANFQKAVTS